MSRTCRGCAGRTERLIDLGQIPLVDHFPQQGTDPADDPLYPLVLTLCGTCGLLQIEECPPPTTLFDQDYRYLSSTSTAWVDAARAFALAQADHLPIGATVVEIAANDGYQLKWFHEAGYRAIGVDPAPIPAARARAAGLDLREAFFDPDVANDLLAETGGADLIIAKNVLAHVPDQGAFLRAICHLLRDSGRCVIEVPWLGDLVACGAIDTIYHEHHCVFSLTSLARIAHLAGLTVIDMEALPFHGGSMRVTLAKASAAPTPTPAVRARLTEEDHLGLTDPGMMRAALEAGQHRLKTLRGVLLAEFVQGRTLAAYGAAAKGVVLLSLGDLLDLPLAYVVDRNPEKHGRRIPQTDIPIVAPDTLNSAPPDICLVLSWNWIDEIAQQQAPYLQSGGKMLVPLPQMRWLPPNR